VNKSRYGPRPKRRAVLTKRQGLNEILEETLVAQGDSKWTTGRKALSIFHQEEKVRSVADKVQDYIVYSTHHVVVNISV